MKRNALLTPHLCLYLQKKISSRTLVTPRTLDRKQSGVLFTTKDHKENGTDVAELMMLIDICRKRTSSFPSHESIVSRNA